MKPDYITLSNGRRVRIEWNMNALSEYTAITGKEMTDLTSGKADVKTLRTIAWCSAVEGEAVDGKELGLTETELGRLMTMACVVEFSGIIARQSGVEQKKNRDPGRSPRILFRKRD